MQIEKAYLFAKQISEGTVPPTPSTPDWWKQIYGASPVVVNDFHPTMGYYDLSQRNYELFTSNPSETIGIESVSISSLSELDDKSIPLYDVDGNATDYTLVIDEVVTEEASDWQDFGIGWKLCNGSTVVQEWATHAYWVSNTTDNEKSFCAGVDSFYIQQSTQSTSVLASGIIWVMYIVKYVYDNQNLVGYYGRGLDISMLAETYGLYLGADWYNQ